MNNFQEIKVDQLTENPFKMIGKEWMLVTASDGEKVNTMTASWGGLGVMWNKNVAFVVLRPDRYTKEFIDSNDTFTLSFYDNTYKKTLSYLGSVSGRDEDKVQKSGLTLAKVKDAPYFEEAKIVLVCKKLFNQTFNEECFLDKSIIESCYPLKDFHTLYIVEISNALIKE